MDPRKSGNFDASKDCNSNNPSNINLFGLNQRNGSFINPANRFPQNSNHY